MPAKYMIHFFFNVQSANTISVQHLHHACQIHEGDHGEFPGAAHFKHCIPSHPRLSLATMKPKMSFFTVFCNQTLYPIPSHIFNY